MPNQEAIFGICIVLVALVAMVVFRPQPQIIVMPAAPSATEESPVSEPAEMTADEPLPVTTVAVSEPVGDSLDGVPMAETFIAVGEKYGLSPLYLATLASCETDFEPRTSSAGAEGLMQVMPLTASELNRWYGEDLDPEDPADSIELAAIYTIRSIEVLGVTDPVVLARAYNAGNGAVERDLPIVAETQRHMDCVRDRLESGALPTKEQS